MLNRVMLIGHLGKDPELRHTQDGRKVVSFSLATSKRWKSKDTGERMEKTEWHNVVVFNEALAGAAESYLHKGSKVFLCGELATRKWTKDGVERWSTEIVLSTFGAEMVLLDSKGEGGRPAADEDDYGTTKVRSNDAAQRPMDDVPAELNDEIPF